MLRPIEDVPDGVIGFEAIGKVEADDYHQQLDPAVATAIGAHGKVRLLYVLGAEFAGYSSGAMWEDTKLGVHGASAWERIAVVSDHQHLLDAIRALGWLLPGQVKTYPMADLDVAKRWLAS